VGRRLGQILSRGAVVVGRATGDARHVRWAWLTTAVFALGAGISALAPTVGTLVLLPIILFYYGFVYWLFRGKVAAGAPGYH